MKNFIFATCLALATCLGAGAQNSIFNNPDNKVTIGVRPGVDITCPGKFYEGDSGLKLYKNGTGFSGGMTVNIPLFANMYIEPGLNLFYDHYSYMDEFAGFFGDENNPTPDVRINRLGVRIPVMLGYHFDFTKDIKLSIFTGPELEVGLKSNMTADSAPTSLVKNLYDDAYYKRLGLLWTSGVGVEYRHFYVSAAGGIGLLNMMKDDTHSLHENRVSFSLGYNF